LASSTTALRKQALNKHKRVGKNNAIPSAGKIAAYASSFLLLIAVVAIGYQSPQKASSQVAITTSQTDSNSSDDVAPSVDELVATDVAADLASRANMPVATNIANASISLAAKSELAQTDTSAITKPQIIQPNNTRTEVTVYIATSGDTVPSIAKKFDLTADTVRWANGISGDAVEPGRKIKILPQSGILYKVESGDTVESIASKYNADASRITLVNDLDLGGLTKGKQILIPDGVKPAPAPVVAPVVTPGSPSSNSYDGASGSVVNSNVYASAGNRYAYGNCTWYVYERRAQLGKPVGSFWGNANTWASSARMAGYTVNNTPAAGAILTDQAGYYGHVAVVERVMPNGDVYITEMNNYAYGGFNIVNDRTISAGQAAAYLYIH
jgi:N-acetylmuramoyl-L-alanine amidase